MHKETYYISCARKPYARKVSGYVVGGIGLHDNPKYFPRWTATHIETGMRLASDQTRAEAYRRAKEKLAADGVQERAEAIKASHLHERFVRSRRAQGKGGGAE